MYYLPRCLLILLCGIVGIAEPKGAPELVATTFQVLGNKTSCPGALPASSHPYAAFLDVSWTNTCPGARGLEISFDERTSLESSFDYLHVTDALGTNVPGSPFTGEALAGKMVVVPGDTVILRLETDGAISDWGFAVSSLSVLEADPTPSGVARDKLSIFWEVENQGTEVIGEWWDLVYVSSNSVWTTNATLVGFGFRSQTLEAAAKYSEFITISVPSFVAGDYYVFLRVDGAETLAEGNENNNELWLPLRIENADLAAVALGGVLNAAPQQELVVRWMVTNVSAYPAGLGWSDTTYLREGSSAIFIDSEWRFGPLAGGSSYTLTQEVRIPSVSSGLHLLEFRANDHFSVPETVRNNNVTGVPVLITTPDLVAIRGVAPTNGIAGEWFSAKFVVSNAGPVTAYGRWDDTAYVSPTNVWTTEAVPAGSVNRFGPVGPGMVYTQQVYMYLPGLARREAFLLLRADGRTNLFDSAPENNVIALPLTVDSADLQPTTFNVSTSSNLVAAPQEPINFSWEVANIGTARARPGWADGLVVATDGGGTNIIAWLDWFWNYGDDFPPGGTYTRTETVLMPSLAPGSYYVVLQVDGSRSQMEANEANNFASIPITITAIDLVPESLTAPASGAPREYVEVGWRVRNDGPSTAYPIWYERLAIQSATNVNYVWHLFFGQWDLALSAGAAYEKIETVRLPPLPAGDYLVVLETQFPYSLAPVDSANNRIERPFRIEAPDLVAAALSAPDIGMIRSNVAVSLVISNAGPVTAYPGWFNYFYLSPTNHWVDEAAFVAAAETFELILPGTTQTFEETLSLSYVYPGNYYLVARIAPGDEFDPNPANNEIATPLHLQVRGPDLVAQSLSALEFYTDCSDPLPESPHPYPQILDMSWTNTCPGANALKVTFDPQTYVGSDTIVITDGTGAPITGSPFNLWDLEDVTVVVPGDTVRIRFVATQGSGEWGFAVTQITGLRSVTNIQAAAHQPLELQWLIRNAGDGPALQDWIDKLTIKTGRISVNTVDLLEAWRARGLGAGEYYAQTRSVQLPVLKPGRHQLVLETDGYEELYETSETNNSSAISLEITSPDLAVVDVRGPSAADGQSTFDLVWEVQNLGPVTAFPEWTDQIYISRTNRLTPQAQVIGSLSQYLTVLPEDPYTGTQTVTLPQLTAGNYYLIVKIDAQDALFDPNPENNEFAIPIAVQNGDLTPVRLAGMALGTACPGPYAQSPHPYPPNADLWWTNSCSGAAGLRVTFSELTAFGEGDRLHILDGRGYEIRGSPLSGGWSLGGTRTVAGDTVVFNLRSDGSGSEHGFTVVNIVPFGEQTVPALAAQAETELLYVVENLGPAAAYGGWIDTISFSTDMVLDQQDRQLADFDNGGRLSAGARYVDSGRVRMPGVPAGNYFLILHADEFGNLAEINETNNMMVLPVHIEGIDLQLTSLSATNRAAPRESISVSWTVRNNGPGTVWPLWTDNVYLSRVPALNGAETLLRSVYIEQSRAAGESYVRSQHVLLPGVGSGDYYLIVRVDDGNALADANPTNNTLAVPIHLTSADLAAVDFIGFRVDAACAAPYPESPHPAPPNVTLRWTNSCPGASNLQVTFDRISETIYLEGSLAIMDKTGTPIPGSPFSGYIRPLTKRVPGDTVIMQLTTTPFSSSWGFRISDISSIVETNNLVGSPQGELMLKWRVRNVGEGPAIADWADRIDLNGNSVQRFLEGHWRNEPLAPGAEYEREITVNLGGVPAGNYELTFKTDADSSVPETQESNNSISLPIVIGEPADLRALALNAPASLTASHRRPIIEVTWAVTNQGVATTPGRWPDAIYLSRDARFDSGDTQLGTLSHIGSLATGETYTTTQSVALHISESGSYYLLVYVDDPDWCNCVYEVDETNNILATRIEVTLVLPDLVVTDLSVPPLVVSSRDYPFVQLDWAVRNQGQGAAVPWWNDALYLNGELIDSFYQDEALSAEESYMGGSGVYLSLPTNGVYSVTVRADEPMFGDTVLETIETNNSRTAWFQFVRSPKELVFPDEDSIVEFWFSTPVAVSTINLDLHAPPGKLTEVGMAAWAPELWQAITYQNGSDRYEVRFETYPGESLIGARQISRVHFKALPDQPSAFVPLIISNLVAHTPQGMHVPEVSAAAGRIVIIGAEPLLEATSVANGEHSITIYGRPGSNVVVETQTSLTASTWDVAWQGSLSNRFQVVGPLPSGDASRFYRARY